ncbi:MAG: MotA/TolQ/ExbB proton channel family protein [Candidatus Latescibacteria bacterium]|nr:MotA/TolQ/ExbB proton channel family protein [bacterium]MBD3423300.1 MotA/TolQ/ExbB proton channel family protein [Candidatus Latescibacterota bacterium]
MLEKRRIPLLIESILDTLEYFQQGGWIMIPLLLASLIMWALILERVYRFRAMQKTDISIHQAIQAVKQGRIGECSEGLRACLVKEFLVERSGSPEIDGDIIHQCGLKQKSRLNSFLSFIAVMAAIAPLLGLLGTVIGMIETFEVISLFGTGNAKAMAGGISVALVTTQTGLLVAIPGMLLSGMLSRRSERLRTRMDEDVTILRRIVRKPADIDHKRSSRYIEDMERESEGAYAGVPVMTEGA